MPCPHRRPRMPREQVVAGNFSPLAERYFRPRLLSSRLARFLERYFRLDTRGVADEISSMTVILFCCFTEWYARMDTIFFFYDRIYSDV